MRHVVMSKMCNFLMGRQEVDIATGSGKVCDVPLLTLRTSWRDILRWIFGNKLREWQVD
jgi:hypothetical protein